MNWIKLSPKQDWNWNTRHDLFLSRKFLGKVTVYKYIDCKGTLEIIETKAP